MTALEVYDFPQVFQTRKHNCFKPRCEEIGTESESITYFRLSSFLLSPLNLGYHGLCTCIPFHLVFMTILLKEHLRRGVWRFSSIDCVIACSSPVDNSICVFFLQVDCNPTVVTCGFLCIVLVPNVFHWGEPSCVCVGLVNHSLTHTHFLNWLDTQNVMFAIKMFTLLSKMGLQILFILLYVRMIFVAQRYVYM